MRQSALFFLISSCAFGQIINPPVGGGGAGTPAGSPPAVQWNLDGTNFGGDATNFFYTTGTHALTLTGPLSTANMSVPVLTCNGTTDVGPAINTAISGTANTIYIPDASSACAVKTVVTVSRPLTIILGNVTMTCGMANPATGCFNVTSDKVAFEGRGAGHSIITQANAADIETLVYIGSQSNFSFSGITVNGNEVNQTDPGTNHFYTGIRSTASGKNIRITNSEFTAAGDRAIDLRGSSNVWITNNYFHDTGTRIIGAALGGTRCGNAVSVDVDGPTTPADVYETNNTVEKQGDSFSCTHANSCHVSNNTIKGAKYFGSTPCTFESGFDLTGSQNSVLEGNTVLDSANNPLNASTTTDGISSDVVTITHGGTPQAQNYVYVVVGKNAGNAAISAGVGNTNNGSTVLNGTNTNIVTWAAQTDGGTVSNYDIYRFVGGATQGKIGTTVAATHTLTDTALSGDGSTPPLYLGISNNISIANNKFIMDAAGAGLPGEIRVGDSAVAAQTHDFSILGNTFTGTYLNVLGIDGLTISGNTFRNSTFSGGAFQSLSLASSATNLSHFVVKNNTFSVTDGTITTAINFANDVLSPGISSITDNSYAGFGTAVTYQSGSTAALLCFSGINADGTCTNIVFPVAPTLPSWNWVNGTTAEAYQMTGRNGVGLPVPYLTPTSSPLGIAFDIFPHAVDAVTQVADFSTTTGVSWMDVCSNDVFQTGSNYECLRLGKTNPGGTHSGAVTVGSAFGGTGVVRPLTLQPLGGNVGVGSFTAPQALTVNTGTNPVLDMQTAGTDRLFIGAAGAAGAFFTTTAIGDVGIRGLGGAMFLGTSSSTGTQAMRIGAGTPGSVATYGQFIPKLNIITSVTTNTDLAGILTLSGGTATYTFIGTYVTSPVCLADSTTSNRAFVSATSTTTFTVTGTGTDTVNYHCIGRT